MFVARSKKEENIAEYIIYMWQIEDLIRANELDMEKIESSLISAYGVGEEEKQELYEWYRNLVEQMKIEGVEDRGHLELTTSIINQLSEIHNKLLTSGVDFKYEDFYDQAKSGIQELKRKSGTPDVGEIEICFNGLYGLLLLKLRGTEIANETTEAMKSLSKLVGFLAAKYKEGLTETIS